MVVVYLAIPSLPCSSLVGCTKFNSAQPQIDRILSDLTIEILQLPPTLPLGYCGHYTGFPIPRSPVQLSVIHSFIHPATLSPTLISPSAFNVSGDEHLLTNWQFCDIVGFVLLWPASLKKCSSSGRTQDYVYVSLSVTLKDRTGRREWNGFECGRHALSLHPSSIPQPTPINSVNHHQPASQPASPEIAEELQSIATTSHQSDIISSTSSQLVAGIDSGPVVVVVDCRGAFNIGQIYGMDVWIFITTFCHGTAEFHSRSDTLYLSLSVSSSFSSSVGGCMHYVLVWSIDRQAGRQAACEWL